MNLKDFENMFSNSSYKLTKNQFKLMSEYLELLFEKNKVMNLTSINPDDAYEKHLFDSLMPSFEMDFNNKNICDVGSGGGLPGIPLAIAFPSSKFTLIEPITKKANFLKEVVDKLGLQNVVVLNERSENLHEIRENFDIVVARAVAYLNVLLELTIPLVKTGCYFIAMKSQKGDEEIQASKNALKQLDCIVEKNSVVSLPSGDIRNNIFIKKLKNTNKKYPRPYQQISRKPL